jgi:epsilon-lactone hydrolase
MTAQLDRANQAYLTVFGPGQRRSLRGLRERFEAMLAALGLPERAVIEAVDANGVPSLLVTMPGADRDVVIVWFHSGGYVMGSSNGHRQLACMLSAAAGTAVLLPDYRLAPEFTFPAAPDDAAAALDWAIAAFGSSATFVGGDSAGGALTLTSLVQRRDLGLPQPVAAALVSPLADLALASQSLHEVEDVAISPAGIRDVVMLYLSGHDPYDPLASPVYADLRGLPLLLVLASETEALRDDARRIVARVAACAGRAELHEYPGMCHAWPLFASFLPDGQRAIIEIAGFYTRAANSGHTAAQTAM